MSIDQRVNESEIREKHSPGYSFLRFIETIERKIEDYVKKEERKEASPYTLIFFGEKTLFDELHHDINIFREYLKNNQKEQAKNFSETLMTHLCIMLEYLAILDTFPDVKEKETKEEKGYFPEIYSQFYDDVLAYSQILVHNVCEEKGITREKKDQLRKTFSEAKILYS